MAPPLYKIMEKCATKWGKPDMERLGLFIEMPFLQKLKIKEKKKKKDEKEPAPLGGPWLGPGDNKIKCGNQDGYFQEDFIRVFNGEGRKKKGKGKEADKKAEALEPFIPAGPSKKHSCPGDYFGCFEEYEYFSRKERKKPKRVPEVPNPITNPGKKGGPGYADICLEKYPEHSAGQPRKQKVKKNKKLLEQKPIIAGSHPQPFFNKTAFKDYDEEPPKKRLYIQPKPTKQDKINKKYRSGRDPWMPNGNLKDQGGCHAGCFEKWPPHSAERWMTPEQIAKFVKPLKKTKGPPIPPPVYNTDIFSPQSMGIKTMNTTSVLYKTDYAVNSMNWKTYEPKYTKYLL